MKTLIIEKPWGKFERFTHNETTTVKVHSVKPNSSSSLQYHNHRSEFWKILSGNPLVTIGKITVTARPGDEFFIKKLERHRIATKNEAVQFLEICHGDFDEDDIIRLEDKYGRV